MGVATSKETRVWLIDWWQIWCPTMNFGLFSRSAIFSLGISRSLFVWALRNLAVLGIWPIDSYTPNLVNFGLFFQGVGNFWQPISGTLFVRAQRNLATFGFWPVETYSRNFVNFHFGVPWYHVANASILHCYTCKVFFWQVPYVCQ